MSELLNLVGLGTGVALYAMLLIMVLRAGNPHGSRRRFDPVLLAVLGLVGNLCALPAYELPKVGIIGPFSWRSALGFSPVEHARFEERLSIAIDVRSGIRTVRIPPLVLQPVVESAVKHGVGPLIGGGHVSDSGRVHRGDDQGSELIWTVHDTGGGTTADELESRRERGVGLRNAEGRLSCQYGGPRP